MSEFNGIDAIAYQLNENKDNLVIYFSLSNISQKSEVEALARRAAEKNSGQGLTGALVFLSGILLQFLEGQKSKLVPLLKVIEADPRHHQLRYVHAHPTEGRRFPSWDMRYFDERILSREAVNMILGWNFRDVSFPMTHADIEMAIQLLVMKDLS